MCLRCLGVYDISKKSHSLRNHINFNINVLFKASTWTKKKKKGRISKRYLHSHVNYSIIHNIQEVETI